MDTVKIKEDWHELKTTIKDEWNDLTDEELNKMEGNWDKMVDTISLKYELSKMEARDKLNELKAKVNK
jgi:uncharacterized protein YjbJ (UPF0337 family)